MKHFADNNIPHAVVDVAFADADPPVVDVPALALPALALPALALPANALPAIDAPALEVPAIDIKPACPTDDKQTVISFSSGVKFI